MHTKKVISVLLKYLYFIPYYSLSSFLLHTNNMIYFLCNFGVCSIFVLSERDNEDNVIKISFLLIKKFS